MNKKSLIICSILILLSSLSFIFAESLGNLPEKSIEKTFQREPVLRSLICIDSDGDGYGTNCKIGLDCNDANSNINPSETEICNNNIDDNCNEKIDEQCVKKTSSEINNPQIKTKETENLKQNPLSKTNNKKNKIYYNKNIKSNEKISKLNSEIINLNKEYSLTSNFNFFKKNKISKNLKKNLEKREVEMIKLAKTNPPLFINNLLSNEEINKLPNKLKEFVEEEVTLKGEVEYMIADDLEHQTSEEIYFLRTDNEKQIKLYSNLPSMQFLVGKKVEISGWKIKDNLMIDYSTEQNLIKSQENNLRKPKKEYSQAPGESLIKPPVEIKHFSIVLFNFKGDEREPVTPKKVKEMLFTDEDSVREFYKDASFGQWDFKGKINPAGDVYGYYTIPYNGSCDSALKTANWINSAEKMASKDGLDIKEGDSVLYLSPNTYCGGSWSGVAFRDYASKEKKDYGEEIHYKASYIRWVDKGLMAHEIGHTFGLEHSRSMECFDSQKNRVEIDKNCIFHTYGDPFDVMGKGAKGEPLRHFNVGFKESLNYLQPSNIQTINESGVYTIWAQEMKTDKVQSLKIPFDKRKDYSFYYLLEYRAPHPKFDDFSSYDPVTNGISLRIIKESNPEKQKFWEWLIDMTPETKTFDDSALGVGEIYKNSLYPGLSIKTLSINPGVSAKLEINLDDFQVCDSPLTALISPSIQSGYFNQTKKYTLNISNNNIKNSCPMNNKFDLYFENQFIQIDSLPSQIEITPGQNISLPFKAKVIKHFPPFDNQYPMRVSLTENENNSNGNLFRFHTQTEAIYHLKEPLSSV